MVLLTIRNSSAKSMKQTSVPLFFLICYIVSPIVGFCNFLCVERYIVSILVFNHLDWEEWAGCSAVMSSWCLVIVVWLFLTVPQIVCSL